MKWKTLAISFLLGCIIMAVVSEVSPIVSIGFWRLAASSDCFIMGSFRATNAERLLSRIVCSETPEISLRLLFKLGSSEAQVYSIYGLGLIGSPYCGKYLEEYGRSSGSVNMRVGSTWVRQSKHDVAAYIEERYRKEYGQIPGSPRAPN